MLLCRRHVDKFQLLTIVVVCLAGPLSSRSHESPVWQPSDGLCGDKGPWTEEICHTNADGAENKYCTPCLVGDDWDRIKEQLGTDLVKGYRTTVPTVRYGEWSSSSLLSGAFRIILQELLGYDSVRTVTTNSKYMLQEAASESCQAINLEVWYIEAEVKEALLVDQGAILADYIGVSAKDGLLGSVCGDSPDLDPKMSGVNCTAYNMPLQKIMNRLQAATDPDIYHLWNSWHPSKTDLSKLMALHVGGGGPHTNYYTASCEWLKSTKDEMNWLSWVKIANPCAGRSVPHVLHHANGTCVPSELEAAQALTQGSHSPQQWVLPVAVAVSVVVVTALLSTAVAVFTRSGSTSQGGPPEKGSQVTLVITDIQGSTSLWDEYPEEVVNGIAVHHQCLRANLSAFHGYEVATEGDSFKCAFHTPEDAICWSIAIQLDLLCAPWDTSLEDGGMEKVGNKETWARVSELYCTTAPDPFPVDLLHGNTTRSPTMKPHAPLFPPVHAASTGYSKEFLDKAPNAGVFYKGWQLPVFRGLLVRVGIHTGTADVVGVHRVTKRVTYGGKVASITKALSDIPYGGQILMSGETLAAVNSMQDLMQRIAECFKDWSPSRDDGSKQKGSSASFIHCGSHIIEKPPQLNSDASSLTVSLLGLGRQPVKAHETQELARRYSQHNMSELETKLNQVEEVVMLVPWPLRSRVRCFPPIHTVEAITPSYFDAPSGENTTIMFTFISGWAQVKEAFADNASVIAETQHKYALAVRSCLLKHGGYEIEGEDDSFVCAFHSATDAVECAVALQECMWQLEWDPKIFGLPSCSPLQCKELQTPCGPRVKVGMCTGTAIRSEPCLRTGRRIYLGSLMNHAARVAVKAKGAQVLLHERTFMQLDTEALPEHVGLAPFRLENLKGVAQKVQLYRAYHKGRQLDSSTQEDTASPTAFVQEFLKMNVWKGPSSPTTSFNLQGSSRGSSPNASRKTSHCAVEEDHDPWGIGMG